MAVRLHSRPIAPPAPDRGIRGFTLLELLVVIGVLSVLTGLSLGFLGRTSPESVAASILAGETRAAQMTARSEGVPTEVWVRRGQDGEPGTVQARLLQAVASFHFEPNEAVLDDSLRAVLAGDIVPNGRFGAARKPRDGERSPLLRWALEPARVDLRDGFVVRLDVWLDHRGSATLVRLGPAVEFTLDDEARPRARLRVRGATGETQLVSLASELALPLRTWCTLDIAGDGRAAWIVHDGREVARTAADGVLQQDPGIALEVSPAEAAVPGLVDEVRVFVYAFSPAQLLPGELQPVRAYRFSYDARGEAIEQPVVEFENPGGA